MKLLQGKNVIITGSRRGIGRAAVEAFAEHGANVWACARLQNDEFEKDMEQMSEKYGVWIKPIYFEMTDPTQMKSAVQQIRQEKLNVDVLVNNAGTTYDALLPMLSMEKAHDLFESNFFAHIQLTQLIARQMMRVKSGCIVSTASYLGFDGNRGQTMYSASKAAIYAMTKSLAKELSDYNIRVNAVAPGVVDTELIKTMSEEDFAKIMERCPMHRPAEPREIANMMVVLASDLSSYVTGQIIRVDGGIG